MSLVEVVIALGILAFAIIPIVGLLSMSMSTSNDAQKDTAIAAAARQVLAILRAQTNFASVAPLTTNLFFTADATPQAVATNDTAFDCEVITVPRLTNTNFADVTMRFRWPVGSTPTNNVRTIEASIANF